MKRATALLWWIPALGWMWAIYYFTTVPYEEVPRPVQDKLLHVAVYFILALFVFVAMRRTIRFSFSISTWIVLGFCLLYAFLIQWNQNHIASRAGEFDDWLADAGGTAMLFAFLLALKKVGSKGKAVYFLLSNGADEQTTGGDS